MKSLEHFNQCLNELKAATEQYQTTRHYINWITQRQDIFQRYGYTKEVFDKELQQRLNGLEPPIEKKTEQKAPSAKAKR